MVTQHVLKDLTWWMSLDEQNKKSFLIMSELQISFTVLYNLFTINAMDIWIFMRSYIKALAILNNPKSAY